MGVLLDLSHYNEGQGPIDWPVLAQHCSGVYIKATEGQHYVDPKWAELYHGARSVGLPVGPYHFADLSDPAAEANHFTDQINPTQWQLVPVLDAELNGVTVNWLRAFRSQLRARFGRPWFRLYSDYALLTTALNPNWWMDAQSDIWAARYNSFLGLSYPQVVLWQHTSTAQEPGVLGAVDEDYWMNGWTPASDAVKMGAPWPPAGKLPPGTVLDIRSRGDAVKLLQSTLNINYPLYSKLVVDGIYGPATEGVVREFQRRAHLLVDGIAGPQTLGALGLI